MDQTGPIGPWTQKTHPPCRIQCQLWPQDVCCKWCTSWSSQGGHDVWHRSRSDCTALQIAAGLQCTSRIHAAHGAPSCWSRTALPLAASLGPTLHIMPAVLAAEDKKCDQEIQWAVTARAQYQRFRRWQLVLRIRDELMPSLTVVQGPALKMGVAFCL